MTKLWWPTKPRHARVRHKWKDLYYCARELIKSFRVVLSMIYWHVVIPVACKTELICKIKGVFDYYSVMNNRHWRLLVLLFGIYFRSGFADDWISQVNLQDIAVILCGPVKPGMCCRSDRRVSRGLTGRLCVGFGFGLFIWMSVIISWLWILDGYYTYVILLFATNESSWR